MVRMRVGRCRQREHYGWIRADPDKVSICLFRPRSFVVGTLTQFAGNQDLGINGYAVEHVPTSVKLTCVAKDDSK
jgi:hypothetical protein